MPATACCSLSRCLPGPWPGWARSALFRSIYCVILFMCYMNSVHRIYLMLLAIGLNKIFLIPELDKFVNECSNLDEINPK